uniref:Vacuolar protein sorting-associated protein 54 n=1 Tax=Plectus sambesii TaxID=2011161 RepID=A0A914UTW1_9BILA
MVESHKSAKKVLPDCFTQNLSSVLSDPNRSRTEVLSFFTRHWGESFVVKTVVPPSAHLLKIGADHFRVYLATTAKKYRHYLKAKRALAKTLSRHELQRSSSNGGRVDANEVPRIFLDSKFSLEDPTTFAAVFFAPDEEESDLLNTASTSSYSDARDRADLDAAAASPDLVASRSPNLIQAPELANRQNSARGGPLRLWRSYESLQERLELCHDLVDTRLNAQLASKSDAFWRAVTSHNKLLDQLADAQTALAKLRLHMRQLDEGLVKKSFKALMLHRARENRARLYAKLNEMKSLKDAPMAVQNSLNTYDYPDAIALIQEAHAALQNELKGVVCFRHLGEQLSERHRDIGQSLRDEFKTLVQKEFGRVVESEKDLTEVEGQFNSVVIGLLRVEETSFVQVIRDEVFNAVKNTLKQVVKKHIVACDDLTEFDPTLGNLGDQMRKMDFDKWFDLLSEIFDKLYFLCRHVQCVQYLMVENIDEVAGRLGSSDNELKMGDSGQVRSPRGENDEDNEGSYPMDETDFFELRRSVEQLTGHACVAAQERSCRVIVARSKDAFFERVSVDELIRLFGRVNDFASNCRDLAVDGKSPVLLSCLQTQIDRFATRFHKDRQAKLANILDSEHWRVAEVPEVFQRIVDGCDASGRLRDMSSADASDDSSVPLPYLMVGQERYFVVGTSLLLLQMMAQYCQTLEQIPSLVGELLIKLVELLKNFNSRTCQLILGAGALQLVGLKTISVRNLALASRCLQLIARYIPVAQKEFEHYLPDNQSNLMRHFYQVFKDYEDHIQEITIKLLSVMEHHITTCIAKWDFKGTVPSPSFQQIGKHLRKFHEGLVDILPNDQIQKLFFRVHDQFKAALREQLRAMGITPHDAVTYGMVCSEFSYYMETLRSLSCCAALNDTLTDVYNPKT